MESPSAVPAHPPSLPFAPLPSPPQAKLSHPVRQVSWEGMFPKTEMGCERLHSDGQASEQTAKQGRRERGGPRGPAVLVWVPDSPLLPLRWGCCLFCQTAPEPCHCGQPPSLSSSRSLLPSALFSESPDHCLPAGGHLLGAPSEVQRGSQLFPSDLYHIIVLVLIVIGAEPHLSNLMRVKWRHPGREEPASWVARV